MIRRLTERIVRKMSCSIFLLAISYCIVAFFNRVGDDDWYTEVSSDDGGLYTVKYAYVSQDWLTFKLYKTGEQELLAERTYQTIDGPKFTWIDGMLIYDTNSNSYIYDGAVRLPPTTLDRWLARLP